LRYFYFVPAQTIDGADPLGAEVRHLFSEDGKTILEKRQMHKAILEFYVRKSAGAIQTIESGFHTRP
jgi:hypothetical protein